MSPSSLKRRGAVPVMAVASAMLPSNVSAQCLNPEPIRVERVWTLTHESGGITSLGAAVVAPDGGVVASDPLGFAIVAVDPSGSVRWRAGRRGDGPGEFGAMLGPVLLRPGAPSESGSVEVVAIEQSPPRSHAFDLTTGRHVRTDAFLSVPGLQPPWALRGPSAILDDGSVLIVPGAPVTHLMDPGIGQSVLHWNRRTGTIDTIVTVPTARWHLAVRRPGDVMSFRTQRFGDGQLLGVGEAGDVVVVRQEAVGGARNLHAAWFDRSGLRSVRECLVPVERLSRGEVTAEIEDIERSWNRGGSPAARSDIRSALHIPELVPLVDRLHVAQDGTLWLRRWATREGREGPVTYLRVRRDSSALASLTLPPYTSVLASRDDLIVVREVSALGEHALSLYRVVNRPGSAGDPGA